MTYQRLYVVSQKSKLLKGLNFMMLFWKSVYQAVTIFVLTSILFENSFLKIVTISFSSLIAVELLNIFTMVDRLNKWIVGANLISLLLFIIWHLFDLSWTGTGATYVRGMAYENVDASLSRFPVAALYIVANLALGLHLFHGAWSLFQSLGLNNPRFNKARRNFAAAFAAIIVVGNVSFPIAVLAGVVGH